MSGSSRLVPAAFVVAAAAVVSVAVAPLPTADAKPAFSQKEGKPCGYCHTNPRGGGPRNEKGNEYQRNGFKFATAPAGKGYGEDEAFKSQGNADRYEFARAALQNEHFADAFRRIAELKLKEDKKGTGYQKAVNLEAIVEGKGRDLIRAAKEAIEGGKAADAADALARVELEFKGREPAKDVAARRADLLKLPGGKEADAKARIDAPQRVRLLDARMKEVEGDVAAAQKILEDMLAKWPEGRFATDAKTKLDELKAAAAAPAMGG
ncbi:MAG: hypothetical protein U1E39_12400 [Planctomycetota bacterium]